MLIRRYMVPLARNIRKPWRMLAGMLRPGRLVYQSQTLFHRLRVVDKKNRRYLVFEDEHRPRHAQPPESSYQSVIDLENPLHSSAPYADYFHLAWIFHPRLEAVFMIGLGGGTVPTRFLHDYPKVHFETVEIDPEVVKTARQYFFLTETSRHRVMIGDGRAHLAGSAQIYDYIILDAFSSRSIPHRLFTAEFFHEASRHLASSGVLGVNINGALTGPYSRLFRSVYHTIKQVFPEIHVFAVRNNEPASLQNIMLFALQKRRNLGRDDILRQARMLAGDKVRIPGYVRKAAQLYPGDIPIKDAVIFSDTRPPESGELDLYDS